MDCFVSADARGDAYRLLFKGASLIPMTHYLLCLLVIFFVFLYNFFEIHFVEDLFSGFRGSPVNLTFNCRSEIYEGVVFKCRVLRGRYLASPWLCSPHLQTIFLNFFGRPPMFRYRRQLYHASDGGTLALDWVLKSDVLGCAAGKNNSISKGDYTPIVVVIPGLTSDSSSAYIKHLAFNMAKQGRNVVISNHRGLGGISITSDCFYNAGWTEDVREVLNFLHHEYPHAPLFSVGTSIGANILVKYLGEDGENVPVAGAAAICSPWDLLIGDRFINRRFQQKFYDKALTVGLQGYAQLHQPHYSRLANWEGIKKSRSIRDFDNYATCLVGKYETVDTYYRRNSSASFVANVSVPLLCVSSLDDPVCTREAIPWDECRANKNIVLATTKHGGHLAFFEGITASGLWWVRAVDEYLEILHSSKYMHTQKKQESVQHSSLESSIDHGPFVNMAEDGMVAAMGNQPTVDRAVENAPEIGKTHRGGKFIEEDDQSTEQEDEQMTEMESDAAPDIGETRRCWDQLSKQTRRSVRLLVYIAIMTSCPLLATALRFFFKRKVKYVPKI